MYRGMQLESPTNALMRAGELAGMQQRQQMNALQMQQMKTAAEEAMRQKEAQAAQQRMRDEALAALMPVSPVNANRASGIAGPRPEALSVVGQRPNAVPIALMRGGFSKEQIGQIVNAPNAGRPKVARQIEVDDGKGGKRIALVDEFGTEVAGMAGYTAPVQVNQGDRVSFVKPAPGVSLSVGMSPSERDASARGWAGQRLANERFQFDKSQAVGGGAPKKPLPTSALKMQQDALDAIGVVGGINADLKALEDQIEKGTLNFGPVSNLVNAGLNMAGQSTQESRNFATFKSNMERLRNESLRLNTGVQTDGDAQRAWNELFQNINDTNLVKQRLQEIQRINARGAELQKLKVDQVRANYGYDPLDVTPQQVQPAALKGEVTGSGGAFSDADKEKRYQEWKRQQGAK